MAARAGPRPGRSFARTTVRGADGDCETSEVWAVCRGDYEARCELSSSTLMASRLRQGRFGEASPPCFDDVGHIPEIVKGRRGGTAVQEVSDGSSVRWR